MTTVQTLDFQGIRLEFDRRPEWWGLKCVDIVNMLASRTAGSGTAGCLAMHRCNRLLSNDVIVIPVSLVLLIKL